MDSSNNLPIYSRDADVFLLSGEDKLAVMQSAIQTSHFLDNVEAALLASGKSRETFGIAIKPNLMTASKKLDPNPTYTDPELVEALIDQLYQQGFRNLAVVETCSAYDFSYQGRSVSAVAEMVGYTGRNYRIVNLSDEAEPFDYGGVLGRNFAGRTWRDADYRVSFAKNKTNWMCFYSGCMKNVFGCLPESDKLLYYHGKDREFYECCVLLLDTFPVHFGFLDAWVRGDGFGGEVRDGSPKPTKTIFASQNIFALDWVQGEKMELSPSLNSVIQEAMFRWGTIQINRVGSMTAWYPWNNIRPFVVVLMDAVEEDYAVGRFFLRVLTSGQDPRFPPVARGKLAYSILHPAASLLKGLSTRPTQGPRAKAKKLQLQKSI